MANDNDYQGIQKTGCVHCLFLSSPIIYDRLGKDDDAMARM